MKIDPPYRDSKRGFSAGTGKHCILYTWDYSLFGVLLCSLFCFTSFVLRYLQKEPLKADVSSASPSSERIEELWIVCSLMEPKPIVELHTF